MIINVWSTPRTGSVWYSMYQRQVNNCTLINEMFNPYTMLQYYSITDGRITTHAQWDAGRVHDEYNVVDGILTKTRNDCPRTRDANQEHDHRVRCVLDMSEHNNIVFHNHVSPLDERIREHLTRIAHTNVYLYRRDRRAQCASYAVAYSTKVFTQYLETLQPELIDTVHIPSLRNLITRIKFWDSCTKYGPTLAYEDIDFVHGENLPVKQLRDYTAVLSARALSTIDELLEQGGL